MSADRPPNAVEPVAPAPGTYIGDRYRVVRTLGHGGMADVFECCDDKLGTRVAIKLLHADRASQEHLLRLFELEFHTLAQLTHPRIVGVYDYHKVGGRAFYSMELLEGEELHEQETLPWRRVCALLCDVCAALSLLHSRRLVHRDVTPRNVRLAAGGEAKLIDFGAMVPFGTHRRVVGTPAFTPPEAATCQPLDGRADLYALGASAYYVLTGRHAYPARSFDVLRNLWRSRPALPSRFAPDVPPELDQLVMSLLALSPGQRPASAAAVIERLTAIANITLPEELQAQRAFLRTPSLVGRDPILQQIRRQTILASHGRGAALLVSGPRGVGRSRLVDAAALEGKLANAMVLRAEAEAAEASAWSGACSLLEQLVSELPGKAEELLSFHAPVLGHIWPRALALTGARKAPFEHGHEVRPAVQEALLALMIDVSRHAFAMITADDLDRIDEPTRAFLALLAERVAGRRLMLVAAAADEAMRRGFQGLAVLQHESSSIQLAPLAAADTERLLLSLFGETPNVLLLASRLHEIAQGLPLAIVQLTQYLLDRDVITSRDGHWILPSHIDPRDLPSSASVAMSRRLAELDPETLRLARALALRGKSHVSRDECASLMSELTWPALLERIDALVSAQVLQAGEDHYVFTRPDWPALVLADVPDAELAALHARVAESLRDDVRSTMKRAKHLLASGQNDAAIDALLAYQQQTEVMRQDPTVRAAYQRSLPSDWVPIVETAIEAADRGGRNVRDRLTLRQIIVQLPVATHPRPKLARELIERLEIDSGLRDYADLAEVTPHEQRLTLALQRAAARFASTPEAERGLPVGDAIRALGQATIGVIGMMAGSCDHRFFRSLPSLAPFAGLSPALALVGLNLQTTCELTAGRLAQAHAGYSEVLRRLETPDDIGMPAASRRYLELSMLYVLAMLETQLGLPAAESRIDRLEGNPYFEVCAWHQRMVRALRDGDIATAELCERKAELVKIRNPPAQFFEGSDVWYEATAHAASGDVARLHRTLERADEMARRFSTWAGAPLYVRGHIARLRGDPEAAVRLFEAAVQTVAPGDTGYWLRYASGHVLSLAEAGRIEDARACGAQYADAARAVQLTVQIGELHYAQATVELAAGDLDAAREQLKCVDAVRAEWPGGAVFGGTCDELRARIALAAGDANAFRTAARACGRAFAPSGNPILIARYRRLLFDAERAGLTPAGDLASARPLADEATLDHDVQTEAAIAQVSLADCATAEERGARVLWLATEGNTSHRVLLYVLRDGRPELMSRRGDDTDSAQLAAAVSRYVQLELEDMGDLMIDPDDLITSTVDNGMWAGPTGTQFAPALLSHASSAGRVITGVFVFDIEAQRHPDDTLLEGLSAALAETGDATPVLARSRSRTAA